MPLSEPMSTHWELIRPLRNKFQWNVNQNKIIFTQEYKFENGVCKMASILSGAQYVKITHRNATRRLTWLRSVGIIDIICHSLPRACNISVPIKAFSCFVCSTCHYFNPSSAVYHFQETSKHVRIFRHISKHRWRRYLESFLVEYLYSITVAASQIAGISIVCSPVCSGADQRKHQRSASLVFVRGIHRRPVDSPHKGPVTRIMFPFHEVIMVCLM